MFGTTNNAIHTNSMSEFETSPTLLYFQLLSSCNLSASTVCTHLKKSGMKAVVKSKRPLLSAKHYKACLDFAYAHKDWTVDDWKRVI